MLPIRASAIGAELALIVAGALLLTLAGTGAALAYARRRSLLDMPGHRRLHARPTPRGGGIGVTLAILLVGMPALALLPAAWPTGVVVALTLAVVAVAGIGWWDDHRALPVWPRMLVHLCAALLVAGALLLPATRQAPWLAGTWAVAAIALAGSVNLHNFMDGIDCILGLQGLFVMLGYGLLALATAQPASAGLAFAVAASCLGFLGFNAPPARIFMGDVGSGTLGLLVGMVAALLVQRTPALLWAGLMLPSAFVVDGGLTLARRVIGGEHWHRPHRQHLYQWLARINWSHARIDAAYMTWNLVVVAPPAWLAAHRPGLGPWCCGSLYVLSAAVWAVARRRCLATVRARSRHARA